MADDRRSDESGEMTKRPESTPDAEPKQRGVLLPTTVTMDEETHRQTRPSFPSQPPSLSDDCVMTEVAAASRDEAAAATPTNPLVTPPRGHDDQHRASRVRWKVKPSPPNKILARPGAQSIIDAGAESMSCVGDGASLGDATCGARDADALLQRKDERPPLLASRHFVPMPAHFNDVNARMSFDDERAKSELSRGIAAAREVSMDDVRVSGAPLHHDDVRRALCAEEEMKNAQADNGASAPMISGKGTSPRRTKKEPLVSDGAGLEVAPSARSVGPVFPPQDEPRDADAENVPEQPDCDPTLNGVSSPQPEALAEGGRGESQLGESTKSVNQEDLRAEAGGALGGAVARTREPASLFFRREDQDRDQHWLVRSFSEYASANVDPALEIMQAQQAAHGGSASSGGGDTPPTARVASSSALRLGLSTLLAVLTCSYSIASIAGQSCRQVIYDCASWSDRWCVLEMQPAEAVPLSDSCVDIAFTALIALSFVALLRNGTRGRGGGTFAVIAVVIAWVIRPVAAEAVLDFHWDFTGTVSTDSCDVLAIEHPILTFHCTNGPGGYCYEASTSCFGSCPNLGNWKASNGYEGSYSSFQTFCASWSANRGTFNGGTGACPSAVTAVCVTCSGSTNVDGYWGTYTGLTKGFATYGPFTCMEGSDGLTFRAHGSCP